MGSGRTLRREESAHANEEEEEEEEERRPAAPALSACLLTSKRHDGFRDLETSLRGIQAWQPASYTPRKITRSSTTQIAYCSGSPAPSPRSHNMLTRSFRSYRECVDALSSILEVSETFEHSRDAGAAANIARRLSSRKRGGDSSAELAALASHTKKTLKKQRSWRERLACCLQGLVRCYVSCMLYAEVSGDLNGLVSGGHALAPIQFHACPSHPKSPLHHTLHLT